MKKILFSLIVAFPIMLHCQEPYPFDISKGETHSILLMGDNNIQLREKPEETYKDMIPTFRLADFLFMNLEGAFAGGTNDISGSDHPHKDWRHSDPEDVAALVVAGIDVVGVANNVTYPWQALMKSLKVLEQANIKYTGGGRNIHEAIKPAIIEKKGLKVGFSQFAATVFPYDHAATETMPGIAEIKVYTAYQPPTNLDKPGQPPHVITWLDEDSKIRMVNTINDLNDQADIVVASFHWGVSNTTNAISYQREVARLVIDAGADIVIGHGPHRFQQIELYNGKPIFYSIGQTAFDDIRSNRRLRFREGLMLRLSIENMTISDISIVPTWREDDNSPRLYNPNHGKGRELFEELKSINVDGAALEIVNNVVKIVDYK